MSAYRLVLVLAGAVATAAIGCGATIAHGPRFVAGLEAAAGKARDVAGGSGIVLSFRTPESWLTRHPTLSGGTQLADPVRTSVARAIGEVPGIGGVHWTTARPAATATGLAEPRAPMHCQDDVEAIVKARSIRFSAASAAIDPASETVLAEVAGALLPCLGGIIAVTGHTDSGGDEAANVALSRARADAVRWALVARGIPADGLRADGVGSRVPLDGLDPSDPANRRIDFSVIETMPLRPTPVDTPGPGGGR